MGLLLNFTNSINVFKNISILSNRKLHLKFGTDMNKNDSMQAKMMTKLLSTSRKKRKTYFEETPVSYGRGKMNMDNGIKSSKANSRRIAVLNKLFMKYISELLVTGNLAVDVLGKGLEISRVAMAPNFNQLNVFWATNKAENITALENILPQFGFSLRHELSQLKVMGIVPRIVFMRDQQYSSALKVNYLLSIADFGEDHEHIPFGNEFKNLPPVDNIVLPTSKLGTNMIGDEDKLAESTKAEEQIQLGEQMPAMRNDIFNLNHDRIMEKVIKSLHKSRAYHRFQPNLEIDCKGSGLEWSQSPEENMTKDERKAAMSKFILERKILREKKNQNKYNSELNVWTNEINESDEDDYESEEEDFETIDFIEDYMEEKNN